jgi:hypothetical protein
MNHDLKDPTVVELLLPGIFSLPLDEEFSLCAIMKQEGIACNLITLIGDETHFELRNLDTICAVFLNLCCFCPDKLISTDQVNRLLRLMPAYFKKPLKLDPHFCYLGSLFFLKLLSSSSNAENLAQPKSVDYCLFFIENALCVKNSSLSPN